MSSKKELRFIVPERLFKTFHDYRKTFSYNVSEAGIEILCDFFELDVKSISEPVAKDPNTTQLNIIDYLEENETT